MLPLFRQLNQWTCLNSSITKLNASLDFFFLSVLSSSDQPLQIKSLDFYGISPSRCFLLLYMLRLPGRFSSLFYKFWCPCKINGSFSSQSKDFFWLVLSLYMPSTSPVLILTSQNMCLQPIFLFWMLIIYIQLPIVNHFQMSHEHFGCNKLKLHSPVLISDLTPSSILFSF